MSPPERTTPERVLAIYGHPDDPEISCGGTLARWADEGADVHILITTRGDKGSEDPAVDPEGLAKVRVEETAAAARVLGAVPHHLDHPDGELVDDRALRLELVRAVRTIRPDVVCCPDPTPSIQVCPFDAVACAACPSTRGAQAAAVGGRATSAVMLAGRVTVSASGWLSTET